MTDVRAVNLNLLLVFDALLATGSVTAAARQVGLTQSGASNALAQLRQVFGDPLFERHGQGMRPTPRALQVGADVRAGLAAFGRALAPSAFDPARLERAFTLAMPDIVQAVILPGLVGALACAAPGVTLRAISWAPHRVPDGLNAGEIDLFAGYFDALPPGLEAAPLYDDTFLCLLRAGHPALTAEGLSVERWLACGHVIVSAERSGPTTVDRALADLGLARRVALRVENALLLPGIVAATDLAALVDRRVAERLHHPGVVLVPPPLPLARGRVRLAWRAAAHADPALDWLREQVRRAAG